MTASTNSITTIVAAVTLRTQVRDIKLTFGLRSTRPTFEFV